jgi:urea transport system permease protein
VQAVRTIGAQNVAKKIRFDVQGAQILSNVIRHSHYHRLRDLRSQGVCLLLSHTRLGLFVRSVTQNRAMASCVGADGARRHGIRSRLRIAILQDARYRKSVMWTDWVRVISSIRSWSSCLWRRSACGTVCGPWFGHCQQVLEGWAGAVSPNRRALFIIVFIQKRPQGLFALKGRSAEG